MSDERMTLAEGMLTHWGGAYGDEGLLLVAAHRAPTEDELAEIARAVKPITKQPSTAAIMVARDQGRTFTTPQRSYPKVDASQMLPDPANHPEYGDDHSIESLRKVGAWRWKIVQKHKDTILPLIQGKRTIDFGGLAGPIGYGSIIVDHGSEEYPALYDVDGPVETIFTAHTLEHVRDVTGVLDCIRRKLVSGGHLIAVVPSWRFEYLRAENYPHHHHTFGLYEHSPAEYLWIDWMLQGWAEVLLADDDSESIIVVARKR